MTNPNQTTTTPGIPPVEATVNIGSINVTDITINEQGGHHGAPVRHPHRHPHAGPGAQRVSPATSAAPEVHYDAQGERVTTYTGRDGASATFTDDAIHGHKITLVLRDAHGAIITHSDSRGYAASTVDAQGMQRTTQGLTEFLGAAAGDRLDCPVTGSKHITPSVNEAVSRTQIQDFFHGQHGDLLAQVRGLSLPVTVIGGMPATLSQALDTRSDFRGCPASRRGEGIVVERIAH